MGVCTVSRQKSTLVLKSTFLAGIHTFVLSLHTRTAIKYNKNIYMTARKKSHILLLIIAIICTTSCGTKRAGNINAQSVVVEYTFYTDTIVKDTIEEVEECIELISIEPVTLCRETDSLALVDIYIANPQSRKHLKNWNSYMPLDQWEFVTLSEETDENGEYRVNGLYIMEAELNTIPLTNFLLSKLEYLYLIGNNIAHLPKEICDLSELKDLAVGSNQLKALPQDIGNLTKLTELSFGINKVKRLPDSFVLLKNLTKLIADNNLLEELPSDFGLLENLTFVNLHHNKLVTLPDISNLKKLEHLYVENNLLESLPTSIGDLHNLQQFCADNNQLTVIPEGIGNLKQLQWLTLRKNKLTTIPASIGNLKKLEFLLLDENRLSGALPEGILKINNLVIYPQRDEKGNQIENPFSNL
ncbi:hypothetical protein D0T85_04250 [Bacteroides sp. 519]|nr:hypothetical protein [Bacteroides sp. 519]